VHRLAGVPPLVATAVSERARVTAVPVGAALQRTGGGGVRQASELAQQADAGQRCARSGIAAQDVASGFGNGSMATNDS
jgi:hypothetical protein